MSIPQLRIGSLFLATVFAGLIGPVTTADARETKTVASRKSSKAKPSHACTAAYQEAQELERDSRLRDAEKSWLACAKPTCGSFLHHECTFRHTQVEGDIPSVIPVITDASGGPVADAQVAMDGQLLTGRIDGRAVAVDPGVHEFVFKNGHGQLAREKVVISQGQRNRLISVSLRPPSEPIPAEAPVAPPVVADAEALAPTGLGHAAETRDEAPPRRSSDGRVAPYLLGTVGVAGVAGFGLLTYWGRKDNEQLAACSPHCPVASVDHVRKVYLGANVALGVGIAALVGAAWMALTGPSASDDPPAHGRYVLHFQPLDRGAAAGLGGTF